MLEKYLNPFSSAISKRPVSDDERQVWSMSFSSIIVSFGDKYEFLGQPKGQHRLGNYD